MANMPFNLKNDNKLTEKQNGVLTANVAEES